MSKRPWMPLYVADYRADTLDLKADQHGVYLTLLMLAWLRDGDLPGDLKLLNRMLAGCLTDMHGNRFNRLVPPILNRFFTKDADGNFRQKRLEIELEKSRKLSGKRREKEPRLSKINDLEGTHLHLHSHVSESKKTLRQRARGARPMPAGFQLSDADIECAKAQGFTAERVASEEVRFRDHAKAHDRRQADWHAAWRNWVRSPFQQQPPAKGYQQAPRPGSKEDTRERTVNALRQLDPFPRQPDDLGRGQGDASQVSWIFPNAKPARS